DLDSLQTKNNWAKIVIHRVPNQFHEDDMEKIQTWLELANPNLRIKTTPYILNKLETRHTLTSLSIAFNVESPAHADAWIKRGIYLMSQRCRTSRYTPRTLTHCTRCINTGHTIDTCTEQPRCHLCGGAHLTLNHACQMGCTRTQACTHLPLKCVLCNEEHRALDK
ncbi:hypothetical protein BJ508DRAFT_183913, partial [Ascobolus immersus RN42]